LKRKGHLQKTQERKGPNKWIIGGKKKINLKVWGKFNVVTRGKVFFFHKRAARTHVKVSAHGRTHTKAYQKDPMWPNMGTQEKKKAGEGSGGWVWHRAAGKSEGGGLLVELGGPKDNDSQHAKEPKGEKGSTKYGKW